MMHTGATRTITINYTIRVKHNQPGPNFTYTSTSRASGRGGNMIGRYIDGNPYNGDIVGNGCDFYPDIHLHPFPAPYPRPNYNYFSWVGDTTVHAQWTIPLRTVVDAQGRHYYYEILDPQNPPVYSWSGGPYSFTNTLILESPAGSTPHPLTSMQYNVDPRLQQWLTSVTLKGEAAFGDTATAEYSWTISGDGTSGAQGLTLTTPDGLTTGSIGTLTVKAHPGTTQAETSNNATLGGYSRARCTVTNETTVLRYGGPETEPVNILWQFGNGYLAADGPPPPFVPVVGKGSGSYTYGGDVVTISSRFGNVSGYTPSPQGIIWPREFEPTQTNINDPLELLSPMPVSDRSDFGPTSRGGPRTLGLTISQAPECDYEGASKPFVLAASGTTDTQDNRWRANNATLTLVNNCLNFTGSATLSQVRRGYTANTKRLGKLTGYRYIKVRFRSLDVGNKPLRFGISNGTDTNKPDPLNPTYLQWWKLKTGEAGEWTETTLDLLADLTPDVPNSGNRFNQTGTFALINGFVFFGLASGVTYEVEYIRGIRKFESRFNAWEIGYDFNRFFTVTDGVPGYFMRELERDDLTFDTRLDTIGQLVADIATEPFCGLTASVPPTPPDPRPDLPPFIPRNVPLGSVNDRLWYLGGGGLTRSGEDLTAWVDYLQNGSVTIPAQTWARSKVYLYDGCGDVQVSGPNSTAMKARFEMQTGVRVFGCVVPPSGDVVTKLVGGDGKVYSKGTPNSSGFYSLSYFVDKTRSRKYNISTTAKFKYGLWWGRRFGSVSLQNPQLLQGDAVLAPLRLYARWYVNPAGQWITADRSRLGRHARAYRGVDSDGNTNIVTDFSAFLGTFAWTQKGKGIDGTRPCVRYDEACRLWLIYESGDAVKLAYRDNETGEWQMSVTVNTSGKYPTFCHGQTGLKYCFWRSDAGAIESKVVSATGAVVYPASGVVTVTASGVAEDSLSAWPDLDTNRVYISYRTDSGELVIKVSADNGKTYT